MEPRIIEEYFDDPDQCDDSGPGTNEQSGWGPIATSVLDAAECTKQCVERFKREVVPGFSNDTLSAIKLCQMLTSPEGQKPVDGRFWRLYCCNYSECGVRIEPEATKLGQDPGVNHIILECLQIKYTSVFDPGPPPSTWSCSGSCNKPIVQGVGQPEDSSTTTLLLMPTGSLPSYSNTPSGWTLTAAPEQLTPTASLPDHHERASSRPSTPTSGDPTPNTQSSDYSTGVKATIAICTVVSFILLVLALWCVYRRRRYNNGGEHRRSFHHLAKYQSRGGISHPDGSPTLLASTIRSASQGSAGGESLNSPLTPPLRLRDRRLLPTVLSPSRPSPLSSLLPSPSIDAPLGQKFPVAPICVPAISKLVPPHERPASCRTARTGTSSCLNGSSPALRPHLGNDVFPPASLDASNRKRSASLSSYGSKSTIASSIAAGRMEAPVGGATPPSSPTRPPRPHDSPLIIPGLVSPGPPPDRDLPATPPPSAYGSISPTSTPRVGDIGLALGGNEPGRSIVSSGRSTLTKDAQDLCELTEECARELRDSWGSWGGGGGGPGVGSQGSRGMHTPVLDEEDLERLGGRY